MTFTFCVMLCNVDVSAIGDIKVYDIFLKIHGIGVVKAKELIKKGIDSIESLQEHTDLLNETQILPLLFQQLLIFL